MMRIRRFRERNNIFKQARSSVTTIGIGNIHMGGSGKTPFTIYLAKMMKNLGFKVAVSHRGYKGKYEYETTLISNRKGLLPEAQEAGDEPLLLATKLKGIPVVVGSERIAAYMLLKSTYPDLDFIILDDSFQHLSFRARIEFVLFKERSLQENCFVFPAGPLREPFSALRDADVLVFIESSLSEKKKISIVERELTIDPRIKKYDDGFQLCFFGSFKIDGFLNSKEKKITLRTLHTAKLALISAIGQPSSFEDTITDSGLQFVHHYAFPDHYHFLDRQVIDSLVNDKGIKYDYLLTTEKDWMKLKQYADDLPLIIVSISLQLDNEEVMPDFIASLRVM